MARTPSDNPLRPKANSSFTRFSNPVVGASQEQEEHREEMNGLSNQMRDWGRMKNINTASPKTLRGIYIEDDLLEIVDHLREINGRGSQTAVVNEALRMYLKKEKWLV